MKSWFCWRQLELCLGSIGVCEETVKAVKLVDFRFPFLFRSDELLSSFSSSHPWTTENLGHCVYFRGTRFYPDSGMFIPCWFLSVFHMEWYLNWHTELCNNICKISLVIFCKGIKIKLSGKWSSEIQALSWLTSCYVPVQIFCYLRARRLISILFLNPKLDLLWCRATQILQVMGLPCISQDWQIWWGIRIFKRILPLGNLQVFIAFL